MLRWALKSLLSEPLALAAGIAAAASALLLVLLYAATWTGEGEQIVAYPKHAGADVWVMQRGVANMHMATSYLADSKVSEVRRVPGVAEVEPILYLNTVVDAGERQWFAYVVGLDTPASRAGPWAMAAGKSEPRSGEAVAPAVFARMTGLELGSTLRIVDRVFTVVGLSEGTFSMANSVIFVTKRDLEDIMQSFDIVSFMLVTAAPGVDAAALAQAIESEVDNVHALTADRFLSNDRQLARQMGVETVALMTFICGALAVLLVAFTVYSQTVRQRRELAVAKALGASNASLYATVVLQAGIHVLASVLLAAAAAAVVAPLVNRYVPMVALKLTGASIAQVGVVGVVIAVLASLLPAWRIARVDPLTVFHG